MVTPSETVTIRQVSSNADVEAVRTLFREYQGSLGVDLSFQDFESEVSGLPGDYSPPTGRLLLAVRGTEVLGCVALHAFHAPRCEMKRLYVRPAARGLGLGRALVVRVLEEARLLGYEEIVLDTLPTMGEAQRMYEMFGFRDIPPYRPNPIAGSRYLGKSLIETSE